MSLKLLSWPGAGFLSSLCQVKFLVSWIVELLCFCKKPKRYIKTYLPARLQPHQPSGKLVLAAPHPPQFWRNSKVRIQTQLSASTFFDSRWMNLLLWLTLNTESQDCLEHCRLSAQVTVGRPHKHSPVGVLVVSLTAPSALQSPRLPSSAEVRQNVTQPPIFEML